VTLYATSDASVGGRVDDSPFFPVNLAVLQPGTLSPVDLFIRAGKSGRFVLYKAAGADLTEQVRARLLEHDVRELYIRKDDETAYRGYIEQNIVRIIQDEMLPLEEACTLVY